MCWTAFNRGHARALEVDLILDYCRAGFVMEMFGRFIGVNGQPEQFAPGCMYNVFWGRRVDTKAL
jgi:hypothetical protein